MISYWIYSDVRMGLIAFSFWEAGCCKEGISSNKDDGEKGCNLLTFNVQNFGRFLKSLIALNEKTKHSEQYSWHWTVIVETIYKYLKVLVHFILTLKITMGKSHIPITVF